MQLQHLTNNELWKQWKDALEDWFDDFESSAKKRRLDEYEDEIIRRMAAVSKPLGAQPCT